MKIDHWWQGVLLIGVMLSAFALICYPLDISEYNNGASGCVFALGIGCMLIGFSYWMAMDNNQLPDADHAEVAIYNHNKVTKVMKIIGIILVVIFAIASTIALFN